MKVRLSRSECLDCGAADWCEIEDDKVSDPLVEIPDALMMEFRAIKERLRELENYFDETVEPQIRVAQAEQHECWRAANPEAAIREDMIIKLWSQNLLAQVKRPGVFESLLVREKKSGD